MPTPTDLRAALRDLLTDRDEHDGDRLSRIEAGLRALADAQPTVAELLPMVDATHEVRWEAHGEERRIYAPDGGTLATEYRTSRTRWTETRLTVFDLRRPARLVEVSP